MAQSKSSKKWLKEHFQDPYVKKAKSLGYRSRAAFKLIEIQEKDKLFKKGMTVVDLGAAPGGWSQIIRSWIGEQGKIIAMDILPMEPLAQVEFIQGDFTEPEVFDSLLEIVKNSPVDLVISDMAPNLSGERSVDQPKSIYLAELALELAEKILKNNGSFLVKTFQGTDFDAYLKLLRQRFEKVLIRKPQASRDRSAEIYLVACGFRKIYP